MLQMNDFMYDFVSFANNYQLFWVNHDPEDFSSNVWVLQFITDILPAF